MEERILKQFVENMKMQFDVHDVTIYKNQDVINGKKQCNYQLERYLSLTCTTIFKEYSQSSLVTKMKCGNNRYMIVLHSNHENAFDGAECQYILNDIKLLQRKIGEVI